MVSKFGPLVGSIDEGTSSARFVLFKANTAEIVCYHQKELAQITPKEGWVEQDPMELLGVVEECIEKTVEKLIALNGDPKVCFWRSISDSAIVRLMCWQYWILNRLLIWSTGHCRRWCDQSERVDYRLEQTHRWTTAQLHRLVGRTNIVDYWHAGGAIAR